MPARPRQSALGTWLRNARTANDLSQHGLAEATKLSQTLISEIENKGRVPTTEALEAICRAIGRTVKEAQAILDGSALDELLRVRRQKEFEDFKGKIREWTHAGEKSIQIFMIRDTVVRADQGIVSIYRDCLRNYPSLYISTLFTHRHRSFEHAFREMAGEVARDAVAHERRKHDDKLLYRDDVLKRFRGYQCRGEHESYGFPVLHPVVVLRSTNESRVYTYQVDQEHYEDFIQRKVEPGAARLQSVQLKLTDAVRDNDVLAWIGFSAVDELDAERWEPIRWGNNVSSSNSRSQP